MPHILHVDEIKRLLNNVASLPRLLIFLDVTTGLRQSELFGLRWSDLDFDNGEINVLRSVVHGVISRCKTESSAKPIPMDPLLAEMLKEWRKVTPYRSDNDWVFASKKAKGKRPILGQSIMRKQIHPAVEKLGIEKRIGWHTFRHSYSTLLRHLGTDIKAQQDLLRHSSARLTLDTYTQAVTPAKREAQKRRRKTPSTARIGTACCTYGKQFKYKHLKAESYALAGGVAPFCTYEGIATQPRTHLE